MIQRYSRVHFWVPVAAVAITLGLLTLQSCGLFTPTKSELYDYCIHDPEMQKRAQAVGQSVEVLCAELLAAEDAVKKQVCDGGSCPLP